MRWTSSKGLVPARKDRALYRFAVEHVPAWLYPYSYQIFSAEMYHALLVWEACGRD